MLGSSTKPYYRFSTFLVLLLLTGCAAVKQPIFLSSTFGQEKIERIYVLPVVDLRFDKNPELPKLDKWVHGIVKGQLKKKEYTAVVDPDISLVSGITEEDLQEADTEWVRSVGPPGSRWVMVIALLDAQSKLTFGSTGNAEVSGYLFDRKYGTTVWHDKGLGRVGQGGIIGMFLKGFMLGDAIKLATADLMRSFPENKI